MEFKLQVWLWDQWGSLILWITLCNPVKYVHDSLHTYTARYTHHLCERHRAYGQRMVWWSWYVDCCTSVLFMHSPKHRSRLVPYLHSLPYMHVEQVMVQEATPPAAWKTLGSHAIPSFLPPAIIVRGWESRVWHARLGKLMSIPDPELLYTQYRVHS